MINVTHKEQMSFVRIIAQSESKSDFVQKVSTSQDSDLSAVFKREFNTDPIELSKFADDNIFCEVKIDFASVEMHADNEAELSRKIKEELNNNIRIENLTTKLYLKENAFNTEKLFHLREYTYPYNFIRVTYDEDLVTDEEKVKYADIKMTDEERKSLAAQRLQERAA